MGLPESDITEQLNWNWKEDKNKFTEINSSSWWLCDIENGGKQYNFIFGSMTIIAIMT